MKRKIVSVLTTVACVAALFAGCGSSNSQETEETTKETAATTEAAGAESAEDTGEKKVLRVALEAAYAPFNWTQVDDSNGACPIAGTNEYVNGYDVMVTKMLCETMGYDYEFYKTDWDALILGLNTNKYDVLICGMNMTEERKESVAFTNPYYKTSNCILVRKDNEKYANITTLAELDGATAITQFNSNWEPLLPEIPNGNVLPGTTTTNEVAAQVVGGKADIGVVDDATAKVICLSNAELKYIILDEGKGFSADGQPSDNMGIAVRLEDTELLEELNAALEANGFDSVKQDEFMDEAVSILPQSELE